MLGVGCLLGWLLLLRDNEIVNAFDLGECADELDFVAAHAVFVVEFLTLEIQDEEPEVLSIRVEYSRLVFIPFEQSAH